MSSKKELFETLKSPDFAKFRRVIYHKTKDKYSDAVDSRDIWVDKALNYIKNNKVYNIRFSFLSKIEVEKENIRLWKIKPIEKPIINYSEYWNFKSECKCTECLEKFWPLGCWLNLKAMRLQCLDKKTNFYYWHSEKKTKTYKFNIWFEWLECLFINDDCGLRVPEKNKYIKLMFWMQFSEFGGLLVDQKQKKDLVNFLNSCWWVEN